MTKQENFINAFKTSGINLYNICQCGKVYYEDDYAVEEQGHSLKELEKDDNATEVGALFMRIKSL